MLNKSPELKAARGYVEKDSFVRLDGSEVLAKRDWLTRKYQLAMRCGGRCEWSDGFDSSGDVLRCVNEAADPHHIRQRSKGRDDRLSNLQALCRYHHKLIDERKVGGRKQRSQK